MRKNKSLYRTKILPYKVFLLDSKKDYIKKTGYKSSTACIKRKKVYLFVPKNIKGKKRLPINFVLYHELNHLNYITKVGHLKPEWLSEGVAFLNQTNYKPSVRWKKYFLVIKKPEKYLLIRSQHLKTRVERSKFYILSFFCIKYLEKRFSTIKIINFLKYIQNHYNDKKFWKAFEKEFGLSKKQLVKKSLKSVKK